MYFGSVDDFRKEFASCLATVVEKQDILLLHPQLRDHPRQEAPVKLRKTGMSTFDT